MSSSTGRSRSTWARGTIPNRHELERGSVLVVQPGTALQLSNRGDDELRLFIYGAPPERGDATFLPTVSD